MPAEVDFTLLVSGLSPICGKPVVARFAGGRLSSDGGDLLLAEVERRPGIAERLACCLEDRRAPGQVVHALAEMIRFRALAIGTDYPDANDCDALHWTRRLRWRSAVYRRPGTTSAPNRRRRGWRTLPGAIALKRMMAATIKLFCDSFAQVSRGLVLDIDDAEDRAYGQQQLSLLPIMPAAASCRSTSTRRPPWL
jgi:hypothetical protein